MPTIWEPAPITNYDRGVKETQRMLQSILSALIERRNAGRLVPFSPDDIIKDLGALRGAPLAPEEKEEIHALFNKKSVPGVYPITIGGGIFAFGEAPPMISREIRWR